MGYWTAYGKEEEMQDAMHRELGGWREVPLLTSYGADTRKRLDLVTNFLITDKHGDPSLICVAIEMKSDRKREVAACCEAIRQVAGYRALTQDSAKAMLGHKGANPRSRKIDFWAIWVPPSDHDETRLDDTAKELIWASGIAFLVGWHDETGKKWQLRRGANSPLNMLPMRERDEL